MNKVKVKKITSEYMAVLYSYWHRMPTTKILYFFITVVGTPPFLDNNSWHFQIYISSYRATLQENIHVRVIKLPSTLQNKIQKLESDVLKPYLMKLSFFVQIVNCIWFQAAMMLNKAFLVGNSATTWKTKHPWIWISFRDGAIMVENLTTAQKNKEMPIIVTVPATLCDCLYIYHLCIHASLLNLALGQLSLLLCIPKDGSWNLGP